MLKGIYRTRTFSFLCASLHLWLSVESFVLASSPSFSMTSSSSSSAATADTPSRGSPTSVVRQFATMNDNEKNSHLEQGTSLFSHHEDNSTSNTSQAQLVRDHILQVGLTAGHLCAVAAAWNDESKKSKDSLIHTLAALLGDLHRTASSVDLDLVVAMHAKLRLNAKKYPVELCKGKAGKYTQYSKVTGVTTTNQSTLDDETTHAAVPLAHTVAALPDMATEIHAFATARQWATFHTPRNLVLALLGEVGELAELVQWKGDEDNDDAWTANTGLRDKLSQELADVTIYLLRIATVCRVVEPVCQAVLDKRDGNY